MAKPFSFVPYAPSATSFNGVSFPRNAAISYRGVEPKLYSFEDAMAAIFGDSTRNIESMMMSAIKLRLMGKLDDDENSYLKYKTKGDWWRRDLNDKKIEDVIEDTINKNGGYLNEDRAVALAKDLINQAYFHQKKLDQTGDSYRTITERVIDYESVNYSDFPRDVVFTAFYQRTASIYGAGILVLQEDKSHPRALDLTFWNYVANGEWKGGADAGEFIFPGYVDASEVIGYELHTRGNYPDKTQGGVRIAEYGVQKEEPIAIAAYKHVYQGETYILIFDGNDKDGEARQCLRKGRDHKYYFCYRNSEVQSYNPVPKLSDIEANLMGVIKLCVDPQTCSRPDGVFKQFSYFSKRDLPYLDQHGNGLGHGDIAAKIKNFKLGRKSAVYFKAIP